ncbi:flagellar basal body-associated FliL family protein [Hydrogenophaga sp. NFH-34]|uniref:flagellar basal body-associated FliL family protein n=1 Tax=Hydrogenophaga sp. NFH-34 TaxID=2744446 RepID=UPI001F39E8CD|nr:flagellar basal body-associated FliL family protein [Hydrogenophaga sp. NFH-34]
MSAAPAPAADAAPPKKSKKLLIIVISVVLVLVLVAAGAFVLLLKQNHAADEGDNADTAEQSHAAATPKRDPKTPPTFMPLDSMVVNLADAGGNRFAQLGITLQLSDPKAAEEIKVYMPAIRNGILIRVSQRTSEEMLRPDGKEALAQAITAEIAQVMGYDYDPPPAPGSADAPKRRRASNNPVESVLFSSFIVQ